MIVNKIRKYHHYKTLKVLSENYENDFKVVKFLVKLGDTVVDIGANFGIYTKFLSDIVGYQGFVYSIEPIPITFEDLKSNISKLKLNNVEVLNYAISDVDKIVVMEIPTSEHGIKNYYMAKISDNNLSSRNNHLPTVEVKCRSLDSILFNDDKEISFIKCDVEGHELHCIKGAKRIIEAFRPSWLIEISGDFYNPDTDSYKTIETLKKYGYIMLWYDGLKLKRYSYGDKSVNYFFVTEDHLNLFEGTSLL
jgi:FkbM family methyltransferase